ncbi:hypothetical protein AVEN_127694-1 [Araneus ventricosus]|uniref:Uncharacterized protein n=1 Tax=Araneus ventricosus TaxID=182803 RepID=A0A4Y2Q5Z5_ARAVE|nr:hypothetical protein AVEN_127694-1 [Araneus ventricosus]
MHGKFLVYCPLNIRLVRIYDKNPSKQTMSNQQLSWNIWNIPRIPSHSPSASTTTSSHLTASVYLHKRSRLGKKLTVHSHLRIVRYTFDFLTECTISFNAANLLYIQLTLSDLFIGQLVTFHFDD